MRALAPRLPAQGLRGGAEQAPDVEGEVALVGEAHGPGDVYDGEVGAYEQGSRSLNALVDDVLVWRESGCRLEQACEMVVAKVCHPRYLS